VEVLVHLAMEMVLVAMQLQILEVAAEARVEPILLLTQAVMVEVES
jgi:hypothetical protein